MYKVSRTKHKIFILLLCTLTIGSYIACNEIFEEDISDRSPAIISPLDQHSTANPTVLFWWEDMEGAVDFHLQIVSPSFNKIEYLVLDSTVEGNIFYHTLYPDTFEWKLTALNYSSQSQSIVSQLIIENTPDLSEKIILLKYPNDGIALNTIKVQFKWDPLEFASFYQFEMKNQNWEGNPVIDPILCYSDTLTLLLDEGSYAWGVKAENDYTSTNYSIRTLFIDTTMPALPNLIKPIDLDTFNLGPTGIQIEWEHINDGGTAISDSVFFYSGFGLANFVETNITDLAEMVFFPQDTGMYYWYLRAFDEAGNYSDYSDTLMFRVIDGK